MGCLTVLDKKISTIVYIYDIGTSEILQRELQAETLFPHRYMNQRHGSLVVQKAKTMTGI